MKVLETENLSRRWLGQAIVRWSVPRITTARVRQWTKGRLQLTGGTNGRHRDRLRQRREDVFLPNGVDRRRADVGHVLLELLVHALGIRGIDAIHPDPCAQPLAAVALAAEGVTLARQRDEREFVLHGERGVIPHVVRGEVPVGHAVGEDVEILRTEVAPLVGGGGEGVQALARYGDLLQASTGFGQGGNNVRAVADPPSPASVAVVCRGRQDGIDSEVTRGGGERAGRGRVGADGRQDEQENYRSRCHCFERRVHRNTKEGKGVRIGAGLFGGWAGQGAGGSQ